jgi:hypothetical protein
MLYVSTSDKKYRPNKNIGFTTRYRNEDKKPLDSLLEVKSKCKVKVPVCEIQYFRRIFWDSQL